MDDDKAPDDDPTRVLDGWVPPRRTPAIDPTRVLDGWSAQAARDSRPLDARLALVEQLQPRSDAAATPNPAPRDEADLRAAARQGRWNVSDVTDVEPVVLRSAEFSAAAAARDAEWRPEPILGARRAAHPRLPQQWQPGAWIGAAKPVFGSVAQVVSTEQGPVVDTFAPHLLLALWPPQSPQQPFLPRLPMRVLLSAVRPEDAGTELLKQVPGEAPLWLAEGDGVDWATVGEAVLLHDPGLREFQLKELRGFVDAERQRVWDQVNAAYRLPGTGQPIERV